MKNKTLGIIIVLLGVVMIFGEHEKAWVVSAILIGVGSGLFFWKKIDRDIIDFFGPDGISKIIKLLSIKAVKFQTGYIYQYAFVMLIGFSLILTLFILK